MSDSPPSNRLFWALDDEAYAARKRTIAAGGKAGAAAAASAPRGLKLIDVHKGKLVLAAPGVTHLRALPPAAPLNLVFIFGNARSGKSFLMNCLSGTPGLFTVVNSSQPCTKGVDLASTVMPLSRFTEHADSLPVKLEDIELGVGGADGEGDIVDPASPAGAGGYTGRRASMLNQARIESESTAAASAAATQVGFVDVEGQGAEDNSYDTMLALPLLLTSKVVLFNHKGAPTVSDMLSKLGVLARAADYIDVNGDEEEEEEAAARSPTSAATAAASAAASPSPASSPAGETRPASVSVASQRSNGRSGKKFGHLHVIFRDFSFSGDSSSVYQQLMGMEPLIVHKPTGGSRASGGGSGASKSFTSKTDRDRENDANKAIEERNNIRALLLENFQSLHIWLLKQPASADTLKAHKELPEELVDPEFTLQVHRLSVVLAAQLHAPTSFNGATLTGVRVATLLDQITASLNTSGAISVPSVFRAMEDETVHRVFQEVSSKLQAKMDSIQQGLPLSEATLLSQLSHVFQRCLDDYDSLLAECILLDQKVKQRAELVSLQTRGREALTKTNRELLLRLLKKTFGDATATAKTTFDSFCARVIPAEDPRTLESEFSTVRRAHHDFIQHELVRPYPELEETGEYRFARLEAEESLTEFLTLKLLANEAVVKTRKIEVLQEEAIKQQQLLVEQNRRLEDFLKEEKQNTIAMEEELVRLRMARDEEKNRASEESKRIAELLIQIEQMKQQKKKKDCVIL